MDKQLEAPSYLFRDVRTGINDIKNFIMIKSIVSTKELNKYDVIINEWSFIYGINDILEHNEIIKGLEIAHVPNTLYLYKLFGEDIYSCISEDEFFEKLADSLDG